MLVSRWDSFLPCNGTVASSPQASAPAADAEGKPSSLSLALAVSAVFLLVSALPIVCAYIPVQIRKEQQRKATSPYRNHSVPAKHAMYSKVMLNNKGPQY